MSIHNLFPPVNPLAGSGSARHRRYPRHAIYRRDCRDCRVRSAEPRSADRSMVGGSVSVNAVADKVDRRDWWCWIADDPEHTYPDASDWANEIYPGDAPVIQRFDWGRPAPSTFVLVYYNADEERVVEEYNSQEEADAALAKVLA
jgi:hypothetical protein